MTTNERFERKFIPEPNSGCWIWTASVWGRNGYGAFQKMNAHRAAWMIFKGEIPGGLNVLHRCDVPLCVNPDHLFLGTQKENVRDAIGKGRFEKSLASLIPTNRAILTADQVREIRNSSETQTTLAKRYGVIQQTISAIRKYRTWKSLPN